MKKAWFREGVVYQIYPRSFRDSDGDGIGDLPGIIEKVPYLKSLGVDILWLSPVYRSPNDDNGYDISDYRDILPEFGTLSDLKTLIEKLHEAGIRLVMDLVVNHTSDEHPWFQASLRGDPRYRDFYHWKKEKGNWTSFFGGSAWEYAPERGEWYLHLFSKKQPDLNWDNPRVRAEIKDMMEFWLDLGVDGFRCDVINLLAKADGCPDGRKSLILTGKEHYFNHPKIHAYLSELRDDVLSRHDCFTVGETAFVTPEVALSYIAEDRRELDMVFQFDHMNADCHLVKWFHKPFRPINLKKPLSRWQNGLQGKGWNSLYLENHDQPRSVSRFGSPLWHAESAKMLATMIYFQQGTPFIYQGQEIGMVNGDFSTLDEYQDVETRNMYATGRKLFHFSHRRMMRKIRFASRDNGRTPMQWDGGPNAGFTAGIPWLKVNANHSWLNVEAQENDPDSVLNYYRKIIALRKSHPGIVYGDYEDICPNHPRLYAYRRRGEGEEFLILGNFSGRNLRYRVDFDYGKSDLLLANWPEGGPEGILRPYEVRVYRKKSEPK